MLRIGFDHGDEGGALIHGAKDAALVPPCQGHFCRSRGNADARHKYRMRDSTMFDRIQRRLKALNLTERKASMMAAGNPDLIRNLKRERSRSPRAGVLLKLAKVLHTSPAWLLTGVGPEVVSDEMSSEDVAYNMSGDDSQRIVISKVQRFKGQFPGSQPEVDARAGASPTGQIGEPEIVALRHGDSTIGHRVLAEWVIPKDYLRHELHASPSNIIILEVVGDSMLPTLQPGDRILIDYGHTRLSPDGLYVIDEGEGPIVKRVQVVRRSDPPEIEVISDNPNHKTYTMPISDLTVVGRVCARITRM